MEDESEKKKKNWKENENSRVSESEKWKKKGRMWKARYWKKDDLGRGGEKWTMIKGVKVTKRMDNDQEGEGHWENG